ncbi:hypothetical protein HOY82DRAFT_228412 [Tuber indicum]|nr:hypothetical protein HOY82DRAFT_228412 [Tuber indicum]
MAPRSSAASNRAKVAEAQIVMAQPHPAGRSIRRSPELFVSFSAHLTTEPLTTRTSIRCPLLVCTSLPFLPTIQTNQALIRRTRVLEHNRAPLLQFMRKRKRKRKKNPGNLSHGKPSYLPRLDKLTNRVWVFCTEKGLAQNATEFANSSVHTDNMHSLHQKRVYSFQRKRERARERGKKELWDAFFIFSFVPHARRQETYYLTWHALRYGGAGLSTHSSP